MTNYEKIKNMSMGEMVGFLLNVANDCTTCCNDCDCEFHDCKLEIGKWLQQEAKPTLLEAERIILENIDKDYKWIARDEDGRLFIYDCKPEKTEYNNWRNSSWEYNLRIFNNLFQFITWEDSEPYNIEELLKGE